MHAPRGTLIQELMRIIISWIEGSKRLLVFTVVVAKTMST